MPDLEVINTCLVVVYLLEIEGIRHSKSSCTVAVILV